MTENALAIAIPAFNRPRALARLLRSLNAARFPQDAPVPLYFVLDSLEKGEPDPEVLLLAQDFSWNRGPKHILTAETALGLRGNILRCGDLTERHAGLIVLEDDLWVSPAFYEAAQQLLDRYMDVPKVGAASLYSFRYNEHARRPFTPLNDGSDAFFVQSSSSWGQVWWESAWKPFRDFLDEGTKPCSGAYPEDIDRWVHSWKKDHIRFLVDRDWFSVVPRASFTTNMGSEGQNHASLPHLLQANLASCAGLSRLPALEDSKAVYDAFFEPTPRTVQQLFPQATAPLEADFYGIKPLSLLKGRRCVSAKSARTFHARYAHQLRPDVMNLGLPHDEGFYFEAEGDELEPMGEERLAALMEKDYPALTGRDGLRVSWTKFKKKVFRG